MISFRNRRATILPSTLIVVLTCHAGLLFAQSPEAWPFDESQHAPANQNSAAPQPKTPVQQKLEDLYRRDGRPLPDYMMDDAPPNGGNRAAPRQQLAPLSNRAEQLPAPLPASPAATQRRTSTGSQGSIRQQLSDYYSSQGKTMPRTQQSWNAAESPRQSVAAANAGQAPQSGSSAAAAPQPRLIDRINPFRSFWRKDKAGTAPPATAVTSGNTASSAAISPNRGSAWGQTATVSVNPTVVPAPENPAPRIMTVELGPSTPISSISPPLSVPPQPVSDSPQPAIASQSAQATTPAVTAETAVDPLPAAAAATQISSDLQHSTAPAPQNGPRKITTAQSDGVPFDAKSESEADKKSAPYTGLTLQDEQDGTTAPDPTKVTTANVNEPADRPPVAPMPAVDPMPAVNVAQPKKNVEQSSKPASQPSVAKQATPSPSVAPAQPEATQVTQEPPVKPHTPSDSNAPKAFNERQPVAQPIHGPEDTAAKMHKIGERVAQKGLKGFCPVVLREQRELVDAVPAYSSVYESKRYCFSSAEAQARFDRNPQKYAPVSGGIDVVVKASSDQSVEGTLDFAAWYKDRLYLFTSPESLEAFSLNPLPYASPYLKTH